MTSQRRLRRFYSHSVLPQEGENFILAPDEVRHLRHSIRLKEGDLCLVIDGQGRESRARILRYHPDGTAELAVEALIRGPADDPPAGRVRLRVAQALLRKNKLDDLVEKAQELGVDEFWAFAAERSVSRLEGDGKISRKLARWNKIACQAAKQSGGGRILQVGYFESLSQAMDRLGPKDAAVIFHPLAQAVPFPRWAVNFFQNPVDSKTINLSLFLGPEGGFSAREIKAAEEVCAGKSARFCMVGLGDSILKADTAFLSVIGSLRLLNLLDAGYVYERPDEI